MTGPKDEPTGTPDAAATSEADRRSWPRFEAGELQNVAARLATGGEIVLVDLSRGGARLQSNRRMLPGSSLSLRLVTPDTTFTIAGRVIRSRIVQLSQGGLGYDLAVAFNEPLQEVPVIAGVGQPELPPAPEAAPEPASAEPASAEPESGEPAPTGPPSEAQAARDPAAPLTEDDIAANAAAVADELGTEGSATWSDSVFHVTAMLSDSGDRIRELFEGNNW